MYRRHRRCGCRCGRCCHSDEDEDPYYYVSRTMRKIINSHYRGVNIAKDDFEQETENQWSVISSDGERRYSIEKMDDEDCFGFCGRKCETCDICIHSFTCSCPDNVENNNVCKHIHACYIHFFKDTLVLSDSSSESESHGPMTSAPSIRDSINSKLEVIVGLNNKFSLNLLDENSISKHLDELIDIYNANGKVNFEVKESVTTIPKIEPQITVISTKRKPQEDTHQPLYETKIIKLEPPHPEAKVPIHQPLYETKIIKLEPPHPDAKVPTHQPLYETKIIKLEPAHPKDEVPNISKDFNFDHSYCRL